MNDSMIRLILAWVLKFTGVFLLLPCLVAVIFQESVGIYYLITALCSLGAGFLLGKKKVKNTVFYAKEGFVTVALCWILVSVIGAIPFFASGEIPNIVDALFESVSGFTTTGASILTDVDALSHTAIFWRSFSHWIGGMGILVFIMAILPLADGYNMHLMRAESPGPSVGKLVPKVKATALTLYGMYIALTVVMIVILTCTELNFFEAVNLSFATAGTGGFGITNAGIGGYSHAVQNIITVFMLLFGVNFNAYFLLFVMRKPKYAIKNEEVRYYLGIFAAAVVLIVINARGSFESVKDAIHHVAFTVSSLLTSTGFGTVDYCQWPMFSQMLLLVVLCIGACAGSTGGGFKVSRVILLLKIAKNEISYLIHPNRVRQIRFDDRVVPKETRRSVQTYLVVYVGIAAVSLLILSLNGLDFATTASSVVATLNNTGPGIGLIGPTGNYSIFSPVSKVVLIFNMLAGRLELFPLLLLFLPITWRKWK